MNRKTSPEAGARKGEMAQAEPQHIASDAVELSQRILQCVQQTQAAQFSAVQACTSALRDALLASFDAKGPGDLLTAQSGFINTTLTEAGGAQNEALNAYWTLQSELAREWPQRFAALAQGWSQAVAPGTSGFAWPDMGPMLEEARRSFEATTSRWTRT